MERVDSTIATMEHIETVSKLLRQIILELSLRASNHDKSKLQDPEKEIFDIYTPKLKDTTYGSEEYKQYLVEMKVALDHHYANNRHHPEYFENGIEDMNLIDLIEMLADWKAATMRHEDGDITKSININQERFDYRDSIKQLLLNTIEYLKWGDN